MNKNEVYISNNLNSDGFWRNEIELGHLHWINQPAVNNKNYQIRVRHRAPLVEAIYNDGKLILSEPERAIAAGQSVVIYDDQICLGGGIIV